MRVQRLPSASPRARDLEAAKHAAGERAKTQYGPTAEVHAWHSGVFYASVPTAPGHWAVVPITGETLL